MRLLLDTQVFVWMIQANTKLSSTAQVLLQAPGNELWLSHAALWETGIKVSIGKLSFVQPLDVFMPIQLQRNQINLLDIRPEHICQMAILPLHHRDPFDRLMISQSLVENFPVLSSDPTWDLYGVQRIW